MNPAYPGLAAAALYLVGGSFQLTQLIRQVPVERSRSFVVATAALVLHGLTVWLVMDHPRGIDLSLFPVASLVLFVLASILVVAASWQPLENLFALVFPLAALAIVASLLGSGEPIPRAAFGRGMLTHVLASILAYAVLMMAACQAVALSIQEVSLKRHRPMRFLRVLPPLQTMETLLFQLLMIGLALLTLSIGSGFAFLDDMFAQHVVHHTVLAIASWFTFAILLLGRHTFGWRGMTAARWTLAGFAFLALAYFGSKFVLEIVLARSTDGA